MVVYDHIHCLLSRITRLITRLVTSSSHLSTFQSFTPECPSESGYSLTYLESDLVGATVRSHLDLTFSAHSYISYQPPLHSLHSLYRSLQPSTVITQSFLLPFDSIKDASNQRSLRSCSGSRSFGVQPS